MPPQKLKSFDDEILDVKKQSLYARLKRLFSTDVIVRNVGGKQLKIKDTDNIMYATDRNSLRDRFNRIRSTAYNAYTRDFSLSYQAARMDLFRDYDCVGPDTIIPLPDGTYPTIKELTEKYKDNPQERFYVYSYDHKTKSIKLGKAFHPRKKEGTRMGYKVTFDNGQFVIGSIKHPFLMRNGEYKTIFDLKVGESVMPFYQKNFYNNGYRSVYNFSKGWQSEHVIVAEQFERPLNESEVVHHKDFDKTNNLPSNLQIMTGADHKAFHMRLNNQIIWSPENKQKTIEKVQLSNGYKNRKCHKWNGERVGKNNPFFGKNHSDESNKKRSIILKEIYKNRNWTNEKNPNFRDDLTIDVLKIKAIEYYRENKKLNSWGFVKKLGCDYSVLQNRLRSNNTNWKTFKNEITSTLNHKIVSIEPVGQIDVYDVTVEEYHNFATDSCIVSNTMDMDPIISSVLDIYADECLTYNELGKMITVHSNNNNVKKIVENLFDEILNVRFNLWSWVRNMVKYGDFYLKLYVTPEYGIYMVEPVSAYNVERIENSDPYNKRYVKFQIRPTDTTQAEILESYEVAHFRLIADSNFLPYGRAMIEGGRRIWKQLSLMEDAMLIHRIMRAPEKRIFYTDIGNIPPAEVDTYMQKMMDKMKKIPYMDEQTGEYNLRFNLQNMVEDYYIPVRGGDSGTKIDTLGGMEWTGIDDVEYLRNKMMAAFKIPKAFLGYEEGISGKSTLACVVPETQVPLLEGVTKTIGELINDYNNGIKNYVYSIDEETKRIVPGEIEWAGFTRMNTDIVRVHLDNGEYIDCTPDHRFMTRNGQWMEAKDLISGQSLMPLYKKYSSIGKSKSKYEKIYHPFDDEWQFTHKMVDAYLNGKLLQTSNFAEADYICIHHKDFNKYNNIPSNLERMKWIDHSKLHIKNYDVYLKKWIDKNGYYSQTLDGRLFMSNRNKECNSYINLRRGYDLKYKDGKLDTSGLLNGKWRDRPSLQFIIDYIKNHPNKADINNFSKLSKSIKYHTSILREVITENNYTVTEFLNENIGFTAGRPKTIKNHKVNKIEFLIEKRDTCDITIKKYHNFATSAGVIIHNSEDVRFARTIQRLQRIIASELSKIAIVHLYAQGYRDESLVDFELELTNPSTIFEKEKIEIWSDKVGVATDMIENKFFSFNWVYKNVFNMSDDDIKTVKDEVVDDAKHKYRLVTIEEDGDDPATPFKKIDGGGGGEKGGMGDLGGGGKHSSGGGKLPDLSDLGGEGENGDLGGEGENGEEDKSPDLSDLVKEVKVIQRDQSGEHDARKQHPMTEDPLGQDAMNSDTKKNSEGKKTSAIAHNFEGGSPLKLRETKLPMKKVYEHSRPLVDSSVITSLSSFLSKTIVDTKKELIKENKSNNKSLLDESQLLE